MRRGATEKIHLNEAYELHMHTVSVSASNTSAIIESMSSWVILLDTILSCLKRRRRRRVVDG